MSPATLFMALVAVAAARWVQLEPGVRPYDPDHSMWVLEKRAPPDHSVSFTVSLKLDEDRRTALEEVFWMVSDPKHEKYGQHLPIENIKAILASDKLASRENALKQYFSNMGATSVESNTYGDMLTVTMPAGAAETALHTTLAYFTHSERSEVRILRSSGIYYLPEEVAEHVMLVGELLQFPRLRLKSLTKLQGAGGWPNACSASGCSGLVTPAVLAERYKLPSNSSNAQGSTMAVAEFQGQYYTNSDIKAFSQACHRDVTVDKVVGGDVQTGGVESELDIEYIKSVAPEIPLTFIYNNQYSLLQWANQITGMSDAPLVHSVSYGNDEVQQSSTEYMYTVNTAFMKAGARGLSILFASGDQGVCGRSGCGTFMHARFHPDFPGGSPYITAVGGTDFAGSSIGDETAWSDSGGGFSDTFGIPDYQKGAVAAYKASTDADLPPQKFWNNTGRGYPDVAALGGTKTPYCVNVGGTFSGVAGTSAACPVVAGVFAKLNGLRLAQNKAPLGFLNPFIYQNPTAFQDVTSGVNTGSTFRKYGFKAIKGWDAATGFGTPNYEALSKAVMAEKASSTIVV